jgi:glycosyltransferase involved in cell wall biosynthesis
MHVLVIYMYYLRLGVSGIKRFNEFCRFWTQEHGLKITMATAQIHHHSNTYYDGLTPGLVHREHDGDVEVLRVRQPRTYHRGFAGRAWSQLRWARNITAAVAEMEPPDLILASSPPLWVATPMLKLARRWDVPCIFEVRDLWPESIVQAGLAGPQHPAVRYLAGLERKAYEQARHIVTLVPNQITNITERFGYPRERLSCLPNGVVLEDFDNIDPGRRAQIRRELQVSDEQVLAMYIGQHGKMQDLNQLVSVAEQLRSDSTIRFVSIGDGPEREALIAKARELGLDYLSFPGRVPAEEIPAYLSAADIGLSFINTQPGTDWGSKNRGVFRNCLFDIAGASLPIVFNMPGFTHEELEQRAGAGYYAPTTEGPEQFASRVTELAADPALRRELGANNYREIAVRYNRRGMAAEYVRLFNDCAEAQ